MRLHEQVLIEERNRFVGRSEELDLMRRHADGLWHWHWLHIYGQSGLGKSSLLKRFKSDWESPGCYILDGSTVIQHNTEVLEQLAEQLRKSGEPDLIHPDSAEIAARMNRRARETGGRIVLLIDAFDNWRAVEHWLIEWLGQFDESIRIITAGRNPLTGGWLRSGWTNFIYTLSLPALSPHEVEQYARKRGLSGTNDHSRLFRFSRGVPLAMTMAAELMLRRGQSRRFTQGERFHLVAVLMHEVLQELPASVHRLLEAACVYWRFNEERLTAILEETVDAESFRRLIGMPFVIPKEDGWMLHDAVRAWSLEDLTRRKPQTYEQMRRRALRQIHQEERTSPQLRQKLHLDKMSLHENKIVRDICFSGHLDDVEVRECRENDLPAVESLYIRYHQFACPSEAKETHMAQLIPQIWKIDPSSFITIWKHEQLIAAVGKIPLHDTMLQVLAGEPLLQPFVSAWKPVPMAFLLSFIGIDPELEDKTRAYIIHTLINHFSPSEWILDFTCLREWFPVFELCGFERAPWADAMTAFGTEYRAFVLDLTKEDFLTKLDRSLTKGQMDQIVDQNHSGSDLQELKKVLKHWNELPRNPEWSEAYARLFPNRRTAAGSNEWTGQAVQEDVSGAIQNLIQGEEREAILGKLLMYTYIQGIRPHERVAHRLGMSAASYYRHLNKALELLCRCLSHAA